MFFFFQSILSNTWVAMTRVLMLLGKVLDWPTLYSAHLSWININSVFEIRGHKWCRSLITFFDRVFPYIVIESKTCDRLCWMLGTRDWIFFTFAAFLLESFTKPSFPAYELGLTIHETLWILANSIKVFLVSCRSSPCFFRSIVRRRSGARVLASYLDLLQIRQCF